MTTENEPEEIDKDNLIDAQPESASEVFLADLAAAITFKGFLIGTGHDVPEKTITTLAELEARYMAKSLNTVTDPIPMGPAVGRNTTLRQT